MRRITIGLALVALAACAETGAQPLGPAPGGGTPISPAPTGAGTPSPSTAETMTYEVWFTYEGSLSVTPRTEPFTPAVGTAALEALLDGPTTEERRAGLGSTINPGTELLGLSIEDRIASVRLNDAFTAEETPAIAVGSLAQIVYTITQFDSVDAVVFEVEGQPLTNFGGYELDGAQRREHFADQLPAILVEAPSIGERVSSPIAISGSADVFEATVSIAILDADGRVIATAFTTATCGTGCRGTYATDVPYEVDARQAGTVRVFESSAMDGSPINVVEIPVTLTP